MRARTAFLVALAVVPAALPTPALAAGSTAAVRVLECRQGPAAGDREARFRAVARRVEGARSMWIRLDLQERSGGGRWRPSAAPGLGVWRKSRPGVRRYAIRQRVRGLAEGVSYRVVARYRWYAADGHRVRRARRRSRVCRQPGSLPNLAVLGVSARPLPRGRPGIVVYQVEVANRGPAYAPASAVRLSVDGDVVDTAGVPPLLSGESWSVPITGPVCRMSVLASADHGDVVREGAEGDNLLSAPCPPLL